MKLFPESTKVEALRRSPLFSDLSRKELEQIAQVTEDMEVEAGKVLTRQGDTGQEFFVILEGEVDIERNGERIEQVGGGDFFGELALVEGVPRTATLTARTPLRFFVLTRQSFRSLMEKNPEVERKVLRSLVQRAVELLRLAQEGKEEPSRR